MYLELKLYADKTDNFDTQGELHVILSNKRVKRFHYNETEH